MYISGCDCVQRNVGQLSCCIGQSDVAASKRRVLGWGYFYMALRLFEVHTDLTKSPLCQSTFTIQLLSRRLRLPAYMQILLIWRTAGVSRLHLGYTLSLTSAPASVGHSARACALPTSAAHSSADDCTGLGLCLTSREKPQNARLLGHASPFSPV